MNRMVIFGELTYLKNNIVELRNTRVASLSALCSSTRKRCKVD